MFRRNLVVLSLIVALTICAVGLPTAAWSWVWVRTLELPPSDFFPGVVSSLMEASDGYIYAGTGPNGDVFQTDDGGTTWTNTSNLSGVLGVMSLLEASDGHIFAGTIGLPSGSVYKTGEPCWPCTTTSVVGASKATSDTLNWLFLLMAPIGTLLLWKRLIQRR